LLEQHSRHRPDSRKFPRTTAEPGRALHNASSFCPSCLSLELETVVDNPQLIRTRNGKRLGTLQLLPTTAGHGCGFCTVVSAIQAQLNKTQSVPTEAFDLFAFSSRRTYRFSYTPLSSRIDQDCVLLSLMPAGSMGKHRQIKDTHQVARKYGYIGELPLSTQEHEVRPKLRLIRSRVNFNILMTWNDHCKNSHGDHLVWPQSETFPSVFEVG
jgi:hypothetical protein